MKLSLSTLTVILFFQIPVFAQTIYLNQWPSFRGPFALGYTENAKCVEKWNLETGENILWQTAIPGLGH